MKSGDPEIDGTSGITEKDERTAYDLKLDPAPNDWFDRLLAKQNESDYHCPYCGHWSSSIGECSECGKTWTPALYH